MAKVLTVFGASGSQGGSVARAVLEDKATEFRVRAVTRDSTKASIQDLSAKGAEIVSADMSSAKSLAKVIEGSHTVFLMTNFWETFSADAEIAQGKAVADACKNAGVQHLVFSSLLNTTEASKGRLSHISHFDGKAKIEEYIRQLGIRSTFVLPGYFMSNLFDAIRKNEDGSYVLALPVSAGKAQVPLFDAASDMVMASTAYPSCAGKRIYAATDYYTPEQIMKDFAEIMGKPAAFVQIPEESFKSFMPAGVAQELLENMLLLEDPGYYAGAALSESLELVDGEPTAFKSFVEKHKSRWP